MIEDPPLRVLLVEDQGGAAPLSPRYAGEPGFPAYELTRVEGSAEAVTAVRREAFDAALVNLSASASAGVEAVAELHRAAPELPIVVLTPLGDEALALRAVQAGAQDYLGKLQATAPLVARALRYAIERRSVEAANKREEASDNEARLREQFIAILSHDLRGPLSSITMNAGLLIGKGELDERNLRMVGRIARSAERMNRMIRNLLDFTRARLGSGFELARTPCGLGDVCRQVAEELEAIHPKRTVQLSVASRGWGAWDADRMAQVISNLVSNALQYSPPGTPVRISLAEVGPEIVIEVHNQGDPICPDVLAVLFDPYFRVRARGKTAGHQGLGLGLYIASQIVGAHGGLIEVRSAAGEGTTFRIKLPRAAVKPPS